jgi:hypothetical protein
MNTLKAIIGIAIVLAFTYVCIITVCTIGYALLIKLFG